MKIRVLTLLTFVLILCQCLKIIYIYREYSSKKLQQRQHDSKKALFGKRRTKKCQSVVFEKATTATKLQHTHLKAVERKKEE